MSDKIPQQESKEFQMKVDINAFLGNSPREPGKTDKEIYKAVIAELKAAIKKLAPDSGTVTYADDGWRREGIRYDTSDRQLKAEYLTLAIEATSTDTKLKCKSHQFVPELLYTKPKKSPCMPDWDALPDYRKDDAKFKLEQDIHFDNIKFCASGSLYLEGKQTSFPVLGSFGTYFPGLEKLLEPATPLVQVSHWDEAVYDDITTNWKGGKKISDWMLVNRWQWGTNQLLEAELSFKITKTMGDDWDQDELEQAQALYLVLQANSFFIAYPPIFTFANPVSSVDIVVV